LFIEKERGLRNSTQAPTFSRQLAHR
jgi:hypothetical protein